MLTSSRLRYLVLAFQLWAITSTLVRAQTNQLQFEPPYELTETTGGSNSVGNQVSFDCHTIVENFDLDSWVLYRNGVPENSTDPCISPGKDSGNAITITAECDGHFSCGAMYTNGRNHTGLVLSIARAVYAIPIPITTQLQMLSACVGDTVFLPSFFPVSALADDVEVTWFRAGGSIMEADIGVVTENYSYKVENISTSEDNKQFFARVKVPNHNTAVNGPNVLLEIREKPVINSVRFQDRMIILEVSPDSAVFQFAWKVDGVGVSATGKMLTLEQNVSGDISINVKVSSDCGASDEATIFVEIFDPPSPTEPCPTVTPTPAAATEVQEQALLATGLVIFFAVLFAITFVLLIMSSALACLFYCRGKDKDKEIEQLRSQVKEFQRHSPRVIDDDPGPSKTFCPVMVRQASMQTSEVIVRFKSSESDSQTTESVNHIATVLYEVIPLIKHWDESDSQTLHAVYLFLHSVFVQVKQRSALHYKTKDCILKLITQVQVLKNDLDSSSIQRSASSPGTTTTHPVQPQQESMQQEEDEERGIVFDGTAGRSISAPAEVGETQQQKLTKLRELAEMVERSLDELCEEMSKNELDSRFAAATEDDNLMESEINLLESEVTPT